MMISGFSRSFSLPGSKPTIQKSYHTRSISLPCRSHPIVSQLKDVIQSVIFWQSSNPELASTSWICDGLSRLEILHVSLNDLVNLPQNQDCLRRGSESTRVLENFLHFADVYGRFISELMAMNDHQSDVQLAFRSKDNVKLALCTKSIRKAERELVKLASSLQDLSKSSMRLANGVEEAELAGMMKEVVSLTASVSMAVFMGVVSVSSTVSMARKSQPLLRRLTSSRSMKRMGESEMERLEMVEECVRRVEKQSERLFRCFLNTRVSLLNTLSSY